jgi:hypothetical protein
VGAVEEAGKVLGGLGAAQPLALALVCVNVLFIGFNIWFIKDIIDASSEGNKRRDALMMQLIKDCTVPEKKAPSDG